MHDITITFTPYNNIFFIQSDNVSPMLFHFFITSKIAPQKDNNSGNTDVSIF